VGLIKAPPVVRYGEERDNSSVGDELTELPNSAKVASEITVYVELGDGVVVPWQCSIRERKLFVLVPRNLPICGSRDSFVSLLEYAETDLEVTHVIVCLSKTQPDLQAVVRLFMFFGFSPLPSDHVLLAPVPQRQFVCLAYQTN